MTSIEDKVDQYVFHGVLRLKQSLETYIVMHKLIGKECFDQGGIIAKAHQQISEVFIRMIAADIFKCLYDNASGIKLREIRNLCRHSLPDAEKERFDDLIKKMYQLAPPKVYLKVYRNARLAHLDHIEIIDENLKSQFVESDFYKWFLSEINTNGKLEFFGYLEEICFQILKITKGSTEKFLSDLKLIEQSAAIFWAYAIKKVKDNADAENLIKLIAQKRSS